MLRRIILLAAALFLSAQPVMACCLEGHSADVEVTPPCHEVPAEEPRSPGDPGEACPGCADCETALAASELKPSKPLLDSSFAKVLPSTSAQLGFQSEVIINGATGPPRVSRSPAESPVSLFQKLLI